MRQILIHLFALAGIMLFSHAVTAQVYSEMSNSALKKTAEGALRFSDAHTAVACYEEIRTRKPESITNLDKLAKLQASIHNYAAALDALDQILVLLPNGDPQRLFLKGEFLKKLGKYTEASVVFDQYIDLIKRDQKLRDQKKRAREAKEGCDSALVMMDKKLNVDLMRLPTSVNGPHIEFNPIEINANTLVYAALKEDSVSRFHRDSLMPKRAFYYAEKTDDTWTDRGVWNKALSGEQYDVGNGAFNADTSLFYFTKCARNWKGEVNCKIWVADVSLNGKITNAKVLGDIINAIGTSNSQPTLGTETRRGYDILYFVSDRIGGRGGKDIWAAVYDEGKSKFKSPRNLGRKINTEYDEVSPSYQEANRKLYYSSDRPIGMGGLDVFQSRGENRKWVTSENVGYPINTNADELYFTTTSDPSRGYFTSNRMGTSQMFHPTCCDDIFSFHFRDYISVHIEGLVVEVPDSLYVKGLSDESEAENLGGFPPLKGSEIELYIIENGKEVLLKSFEVDDSGEFALDLEGDKEYRMEVSKLGFLNNYIKINTIGQTFSDTLGIDLGLAKLNDAPILIPNIYYGFDSAVLTDKAKASIQGTLLKILEDNPDIKIEIGAHTDSHGEDAYNLRLSQERAQSVANYLISDGISPKRLIARGYGEEQHIAPNTFEDGSDNPNGRSKNRRTEFTIIGNTSQF